MSSVSVSSVNSFLPQVDINGDGCIDRREAALGAIRAGNQGNSELAGFFSTLAMGGKDQQGYLPECGASAKDLAALAAKSGDPAAFENSDFQAANPNNFNANPGNATVQDLWSVFFQGHA